MCGGTARANREDRAYYGLSPRVRGNRCAIKRRPPPRRSIPACAGEPFSRLGFHVVDVVYPRVCGGTLKIFGSEDNVTGLSPRVRGNRKSILQCLALKRSIPACAGEPLPCKMALSEHAVYPRVCGGTSFPYGSQAVYWGLSPRVRGNPLARMPGVADVRSIPACAGEPWPESKASDDSQVYPRVCGGTESKQGDIFQVRGLSPRVRGNRASTKYGDELEGSIPACAGEPTCSGPGLASSMVYPRVCGGTVTASLASSSNHGLSPRVRGNPLAAVVDLLDTRSIPACAGEPRACPTRTCAGVVYPRVCGGTTITRQSGISATGLSPRVRGNPPVAFRLTSRLRSIPACAGEPGRCLWRGWPRGVYPRVCGGTQHTGRRPNIAIGLSPRVRGNRISSGAVRK